MHRQLISNTKPDHTTSENPFNMNTVDDIIDAVMEESTWRHRLRIPILQNENTAPEDALPYVPDPRLPKETDPDLPRLQHVHYDVRISYTPPKMLVTGLVYGVVRKVDVHDLSNGIGQAEMAKERMMEHLEERWGNVEPPEDDDTTLATQNIQTALFPLQPFSTLGLMNAYAYPEPDGEWAPAGDLDLSSLTLSGSEEEQGDDEATNNTGTARIVFGSLHNMKRE
jgi:hypothetical protein